ncbi:MAG: DEAD/DEAH box helicase [Firmicutes bacterium]|nr:DEAD/DEAH box helicase [Bacillota bacterium]
MKYSESNVHENILKALDEMGFVDMTPIQERAIPVLQSGKDIIGQAQTGTGKTASFGIPMIESIDKKCNGIQGLVLCPTRELAIQASEEIKKMSKYMPHIGVVAIYGGQDIGRQFRLLQGKANIIVGTPGRIMDHMERGTLAFPELKMLVLDEADEMLNMGFREDIETICQELPEERQTALFSATMPQEILEITDEYQKDAELVRVEAEEMTVTAIKQSYYIIKGREKDTSLCRLIDYMSPKRALIFCNTKRKVDQLTLVLKAKGYSAEAIHGDLSQHQRDRVMNLFRNGNLELLLATDVAARGIDVDDVDMVFNYDMPQDMEWYVHRIGRTGRAGRRGKAISLITAREQYKIDSLEEYCNTRIKLRDMPTAGSAMTVKAHRTVADAIEYCDGKDLNAYMKIVYKKCVEEEHDPLYVAACFLRQNLGELEVEVGEETKQDRKANREKRERREREKREKRKLEVPGSRGSRERDKGDRDKRDRKKDKKEKTSGKSKSKKAPKQRHQIKPKKKSKKK